MRIPSGFAAERVSLIRQMEADGWTGRITTNGHAFMSAPDGQTTCSIVPKTGSPTRSAANQAAPYRRWKKALEAAAEVSAAAVEPEPAVVDTVCPICGKDGFATSGYVRTHIAHAHRRVACPVCRQETSPAQANRHLASHYREADSVGQLRRDLRRAHEEIEHLRREIEDWKALAEEAVNLL
jgi:hypothetical protein